MLSLALDGICAKKPVLVIFARTAEHNGEKLPGKSHKLQILITVKSQKAVFSSYLYLAPVGIFCCDFSGIFCYDFSGIFCRNLFLIDRECSSGSCFFFPSRSLSH